MNPSVAFLGVSLLAFVGGSVTEALGADATAPKPLFRDPVYDGAADPVVVWNPQKERWWMFYTNRRANVPGLSGVAWVHGTPLGIAESADGATWRYVGQAEIKIPADVASHEPTYWAPEIVTDDAGLHHLFLTIVPGVFENWQHPRLITHLTSSNLRTWTFVATLKLGSDRVIDPAIHRLPDGTWRMWYNNERDGKGIWHADSPDLQTWTDRGPVMGVAKRCEGPKVFHWHGTYWLITDEWRGLAVYRSADAATWVRQPGENLLAAGGSGTDDQVKGQHADVIVQADRAWIFYFTHPGRRDADQKKDGTEQRRSSIQVAELRLDAGRLTCDRDRATAVDLGRPSAGRLAPVSERPRSTL